MTTHSIHMYSRNTYIHCICIRGKDPTDVTVNTGNWLLVHVFFFFFFFFFLPYILRAPADYLQ